MTNPTQRQQLLDMSAAHVNIDAACDLLTKATEQIDAALRTGHPVAATLLNHLNNSVLQARIAREFMRIHIKRMP
jgi:hypothetical protein